MLRKKLERCPALNSKKTKSQFNFNLPVEYVVSKFYQYGYKVTHNRYSNTYNSCCPLCHEGKSWGKKKRCFYSPENGTVFCYNCGESLTSYNWIRKVSGMTHQELVESLEEDDISYDFYQKEEERHPPTVDKLPKDCINLFDPTQCSYYKDNKVVQKALSEISRRRLDTAVNRPRAFFISLSDEFQKNRIVIPFYDEEDNVVFYQTRKLFDYDDEEPAYKSKYCADKSIFGIDKVDPEMDCVFLFEGPFDSCFVKNGLAVAGISESKKFTMTETQKQQMNGLVLLDKIWVLDSQWLDETAKKKSLHLLEMGEKVFIWPKKWGTRYKDFNQMCQDLQLDQISPTFIKENSYEGSKGILKYKLMFRK